MRELRQNLSVYVQSLRSTGQAYEVTERGEPVARLMPLEGRGTHVEQMMADGRIAPGSRPIAEVPRPLRRSTGPTLSALLSEQREEHSR